MDDGLTVISACLAGVCCRYDGGCKPNAQVLKLLDSGAPCRLFCPEQLGGLTIPHLPSEIVGGTGADVLAGRASVCAKDGTDVTDAFIAGAKKSLALAQSAGARRALLKAKSPSCGVGRIYDGTFTGRLREGDGVTAALLRAHGIDVLSAES